MKIKLRPDHPGSSGPTEWSEMNDWLAELREDPDDESGEARDEAAGAANPEDDGRGPSQAFIGPQPQAGAGAHPSGSWAVASPAETYAAPVLGEYEETHPADGANGAGEADGADGAGPEVTSEADEAGVVAGDHETGAYEVSGLYEPSDSYEVPAAGLAAGADAAAETEEPDAAGVTGEAPADVAADAGVSSVTGEASATSATRVFGAASEADQAEVPSAAEVSRAASAAPTSFTPPRDLTPPRGLTPPGGFTPAGSTTPPGGFAWSPSPGHPTGPSPSMPSAARVAPATPPRPPEPEPITVGSLIGDQLRTPMVWCELDPGSCVSWHADREALGQADVRARAITAGWRIDAMGRLTCPQCQQRSASFRATQQVVVWNRAYALTMAAREAARQGQYPYPQPAFYPR